MAIGQVPGDRGVRRGLYGKGVLARMLLSMDSLVH